MKVTFRVICLFFFLTATKFSFCQQPLITDAIEDKVIISFPNVTTAQLNDIKTEFLKYNQIVTAKYIYGNHNVMLITFDNNQPKFATYYDLLKIITPYFNTDDCRFKVKIAFDDILNSLTTEPIFQLK
ncbi:MAG: hypothetical protein H0U95_16150 [Bacteroidetes bacterium]|nr:hypothetical protein [Bacteroidota bacterium]